MRNWYEGSPSSIVNITIGNYLSFNLTNFPRTPETGPSIYLNTSDNLIITAQHKVKVVTLVRVYTVYDFSNFIMVNYRFI